MCAADSQPDLSLWDTNMKPQKLSQYRGKIVVLNFWATWCEACKMELPMLVEEQEHYRRRGVIVYPHCSPQGVQPMSAGIGAGGPAAWTLR